MRRFLFVRFLQQYKATVRLQSQPLIDELSKDPNIECITYPNRETKTPLHLLDECCIVFHYDDDAAIKFIRNLNLHQKIVVCLGSDIYAIQMYRHLCDIVSFFLMPSDIHVKVLQSLVTRPVYKMIEVADKPGDGSAAAFSTEFPRKSAKRIVWFGYSESFYPGMATLIPSIRAALHLGHIDSFSVICDSANFENSFGLDVLEYKSSSFSSDVKSFDYALLSHFSGDLRLNSYVKSPNKAITALTCGLIPVLSDTPNYRDIAETLNITPVLFSSPFNLYEKLTNLNPQADTDLIRDRHVIEKLYESYSSKAVTMQFNQALSDYRKGSRATLEHELEPYRFSAEEERKMRFLFRGQLGPLTIFKHLCASLVNTVRREIRKYLKRFQA